MNNNPQDGSRFDDYPWLYDKGAEIMFSKIEIMKITCELEGCGECPSMRGYRMAARLLMKYVSKRIQFCHWREVRQNNFVELEDHLFSGDYVAMGLILKNGNDDIKQELTRQVTSLNNVLFEQSNYYYIVNIGDINELDINDLEQIKASRYIYPNAVVEDLIWPPDNTDEFLEYIENLIYMDADTNKQLSNSEIWRSYSIVNFDQLRLSQNLQHLLQLQLTDPNFHFGIKNVELDGATLNTSDIHFISCLTSLRSLKLSRCKAPQNEIGNLLKCLCINNSLKSLLKLDLSHSRISGEDAKTIPKFHGLTYLNLSHCRQIREIDWINIISSVSKNIIHLNLDGTLINIASTKYLDRLKYLESLSMNDCSGVDHAMHGLFIGIEELSVENSDISVWGALKLCRFSRLKVLRLNGCENIDAAAWKTILKDFSREIEILELNTENFPEEVEMMLYDFSSLKELSIPRLGHLVGGTLSSFRRSLEERSLQMKLEKERKIKAKEEALCKLPKDTDNLLLYIENKLNEGRCELELFENPRVWAESPILNESQCKKFIEITKRIRQINGKESFRLGIEHVYLTDEQFHREEWLECMRLRDISMREYLGFLINLELSKRSNISHIKLSSIEMSDFMDYLPSTIKTLGLLSCIYSGVRIEHFRGRFNCLQTLDLNFKLPPGKLNFVLNHLNPNILFLNLTLTAEFGTEYHHFKKFQQLKWLNLVSGDHLSSDSWSMILKAVPNNLKALCLGGNYNGESAAALNNCIYLEALSLLGSSLWSSNGSRLLDNVIKNFPRNLKDIGISYKKSLDFSGWNLSTESWNKLVSFFPKSLEEISFSSSNYGEGIMTVSGINSLKCLALSGCQLNSTCWERLILSWPSRMEELYLWNTNYCGEAIDKIKSKSNLKKFIFWNPNLPLSDPKWNEILENLPSSVTEIFPEGVSELSMENMQLSPSNWNRLILFFPRSVEEINFSGSNYHRARLDLLLDIILGLPNVKRLIFDNFPLHSQMWEMLLSSLPAKLEEISLLNTNYGGEAIDKIKSKSNLKKFIFWNPNLPLSDPKWSEILENLPSSVTELFPEEVSELSMENMQLSPANWNRLILLFPRSLEDINFSGSNYAGARLDILCDSHYVKRLNFDNCSLHSEMWEMLLLSLPAKLEEISLLNTNYGGEAIDKIKSKSNLKKFIFWNPNLPLSDPKWNEILENLPSSVNKLSYTNYSGGDCNTVESGSFENSALKLENLNFALDSRKFDFSNHQLPSETWNVILRAIPTEIDEIVFTNSNYNLEEFEGFTNFDGLKRLSFSGLQLAYDSWLLFMRNLPKNLISLDLSGSSYSGEGSSYFLLLNQLETLNLCGCNLSEDEQNYIKSQLDVNDSSSDDNCSDDNFSDDNCSDDISSDNNSSDNKYSDGVVAYPVVVLENVGAPISAPVVSDLLQEKDCDSSRISIISDYSGWNRSANEWKRIVDLTEIDTEIIRFANSNYSGEGIEQLQNFIFLKELDLKNCNISEEISEYILLNLQEKAIGLNLEKVDFQGLFLPSKNWEKIMLNIPATVQEIIFSKCNMGFNIGSCNYNGERIENLLRLASLKKINFSNCKFSSYIWQKLIASLPSSVEELNLSTTNYKEHDLDIQHLPNLKKLDLSGCIICVPCWETLFCSGFPLAIEEINLRGSTYNGEKNSEIKRLVNLKKLYISDDRSMETKCIIT